MKKSDERYEELCKRWEELGLQNVCAKEAAVRLGTNATTLVLALKTRRPGAYNPNHFKGGRKPRMYVYQKCRYCGDDTSIRIDLSTVDEAENKKLGKTSMYVCENCISKNL